MTKKKTVPKKKAIRKSVVLKMRKRGPVSKTLMLIDIPDAVQALLIQHAEKKGLRGKKQMAETIVMTWAAKVDPMIKQLL